MINVKSILLLSLAAYVACGDSSSDNNEKPQFPNESPEQETDESDQDQEDGILSFEKDDLIFIDVKSKKHSRLYWMVVKKDDQCPEPLATDVIRVIKPDDSVYNDVLNGVTKTENENKVGQDYVHYKYFALRDGDEPVSPVSPVSSDDFSYI